MSFILTPEQQRNADQFTIQNEPISSIDLMERAAIKLAEAVVEIPELTKRIFFLCGMGNNGGDGLALARILSKSGYQCIIFIVNHREKGSHEFEVNLNRAKELNLEINHWDSNLQVDCKESFWIDALLGSGFNGNLEGECLYAIQWLNRLNKRIISIDIPSGMPGWIPPHKIQAIVDASYTFSIQFPKLAFLLPELGNYAGQWQVIDIGIKANQVKSDSIVSLIEIEEVKKILPPRPIFSYKGNYGHTLLYAGSEGMWGASVLACQGALGSGVGKLTLLTESDFAKSLVVNYPEVMSLSWGSNFQVPNGITAIAIGPGIGRSKEAEVKVNELISNFNGPILLDADAIFHLSKNPNWLQQLKGRTILTPHLGEAHLLLNLKQDWADTLTSLTHFCREFELVILLKNRYSCIISSNGDWSFNPTGSPWMARGGTGDVLSGLIIGLMAQGISLTNSGIAGAYIHGLVGADLPPTTSWTIGLWKKINELACK